MKTIYLHGYLKEKFGPSFTFDVGSPTSAIQALLRQIKGLPEAVQNGQFVIIRGPKDTGYSIDVPEFDLKFGKTTEMHIVPVLGGAGGRTGGIIKIVLGVALLAVGIGGAVLASAGLAGGVMAGFSASIGFAGLHATWGTLAIFGAGMALAGVSSMLTPRSDLNGGSYENRETPDERPSFLFNGPQNQSSQGLPVPLVYGFMRGGSMVVSSGIATEAL